LFVVGPSMAQPVSGFGIRGDDALAVHQICR
jgi:hypothetical protein